MDHAAPLLLVIEDSQNIRTILVDTLKSAGYRVHDAGTALEGASLARKERPDLILADVGLPDQDGALAMSCLKDHPEFKAVPLMLVSALPPDQLEVKMSEAGAQDVLHKPFKRADLLDRVKKWAGRRDAPPAEPPPAIPGARRPTPSLTPCESCGTSYDAGKPACPACATLVGHFLDRHLTSPERSPDLLLKVLHQMDSRWGLNSFASGWKLVDVALRVVVSFALVALAFSASIALENEAHGAISRLEDHRAVYAESAAAAKRSPDLERLRTHYDRLIESSAVLVEDRTREARLRVWVLLGLLAFVLVTGVYSYRAHKESNRIRAALAFILTSQGRAYSELLQRQRLQEEAAVRHQTAHPASGS